MSPDDLKRLSAGFVQAANVAGSNIQSSIPDLANYARASFIDPVIDKGTKAAGNLAGALAQKEEQAAARAEQARKDAMDPKNFQKVRKADGGFSFFDGSGKEVGIDQYAKATGQRRAEILQDSENPIDLQYINDFKNMNEFAQSIYNGDKETRDAFIAQNPNLRNATPESIMKQLAEKYPHMYGMGGGGNAAYQQTLKNRNKQVFGFNPNYLTGASGGSGSGGGIPR